MGGTSRLYHLTNLPPVNVGDIVRIGDHLYAITKVEPLIYEFRNYEGNVEVGFVTNKYPVPDMIPSKEYIYYIRAVGVQGHIRFKIYYPSGVPIGVPNSNVDQYLDWIQAPYDDPFQIDIAVISGDTLEVGVVPEYPYLRGAIWFYGYKLKKIDKTSSSVPPKLLRDVREVKINA